MMSTSTVSTLTKPARRESTVLLYNAIRQEYNRMKGIKKNGVIYFSQDYIIQEVANKFYKSPKTIENIIFNRV